MSRDGRVWARDVTKNINAIGILLIVEKIVKIRGGHLC